MKITYRQEKFSIDNSHPFVEAILAIARTHARPTVVTPERNDVKRLWRLLSDSHKKLLKKIASHPGGVSQRELITAIGLNSVQLRGVHNGLARICEGADIEKPIRVAGYNATNRSYSMDQDVRVTILAARE